MDLLDQAGREPSNCPNDWDEPADTAEIDLERATWDADYRSQVLDLLRRKRRAAEDRAETAPSMAGEDREQQP